MPLSISPSISMRKGLDYLLLGKLSYSLNNPLVEILGNLPQR